MQLAKVIGTVVATRKNENLSGVRLVIVQRMNRSGQPTDLPEVAVDTLGARYGTTVVMVRGTVSSFTLPAKFAPVDRAVVGIIDRLDVDNSDKEFHDSGRVDE